MKKIVLASIACATLMFASTNDYKYEMTTLIGGTVNEGNMGMDRGSVNAGLAIGFNVQESSVFDQVEIGFMRSLGEVDYTNLGGRDTGITRVFTNVVKEYDITNDISLYSLAGLGVEIFESEANGNKNGMFGNYGAGVKYKLADQLAVKLDVRHAIEFDHGDSTLLYNLGISMPFGKIARDVPVTLEEPVLVKEPVAIKIAPKDSDNDGIIDELDNCPGTIEGAKVDSVGCMTLVNLDINFENNSDKISGDYGKRISQFADMLNQDTRLSATIEGHTDSVGTESYNKNLAEKRANSTVKALKDLNVDSDRLKAVSYGESKPVASNSTAEGRAENRRVNAVLNR